MEDKLVFTYGTFEGRLRGKKREEHVLNRIIKLEFKKKGGEKGIWLRNKKF